MRKTTSIGMFLGLIKPTSGSIKIDGIDINHADRTEILSCMNFASSMLNFRKINRKTKLRNLWQVIRCKKSSERIDEIANDST